MNKILIFKEDNLNLKKTISILILVMITSGVFGFIYETIFYKIDLGYFVKRGSTFGPWIPIYAFGGLLITLFTYNLRKSPVLVFIINCLVTGILEFLTGYILLKLCSIRLWDYNTEIWNYGNIGGFICLRSVLFFGISSLLLIYLIVPLLKSFAVKTPEKKLTIISTMLGSLFLIDVLVYMIIK